MSGVLDQILLDEIAKYCPEKFLGYHRCMMDNKTDPTKCIPIQQQLAECIKTDVPAFQRIQTECMGKLKSYESCLRKNVNDNPTSKCFDDLQGLRQCASGSIDVKADVKAAK